MSRQVWAHRGGARRRDHAARGRHQYRSHARAEYQAEVHATRKIRGDDDARSDPCFGGETAADRDPTAGIGKQVDAVAAALAAAWLTALSPHLHAPLMVLAMAAAAVAWLPAVARLLSRDGLWALWVLSLVMVHFTLLHVVGAPFPRYGIPLRPLAYVMSMVPLALFWQWWRARGAGR